MSILEILLFLMTLLFFLVGFLGIFLPVIPSLPVIWCGILLYGICTNFSEVTILIVVITGMLMLMGTACDLFASSFGAKTYGASWYGVGGSFIGSIVGTIFFNFVGFIVGAFLGACIGEFILYKKIRIALKAGVGTIVGFLFGVGIKIFISFLMFGIFLFALL